MKKGLIIGACFLFILIVLMSFVSAGFFSDFWGKITGKAVDDCVDSDGGQVRSLAGTVTKGAETFYDYCEQGLNSVVEGYCDAGGVPNDISMSCPNGCVTNAEDIGYCAGTCDDSEEGQVANVAGTVTINDLSYPDSCEDESNLLEWYCDGNGLPDSIAISCLHNDCIGGACTTTCHDSDGGNYPFIAGTVTIEGIEYDDFCSTQDPNLLYEQYCEGDLLEFIDIYCPNGCEIGLDGRGACIPTCIDSDGGQKKYIPGTVTLGDVVHNDECEDPGNLLEMYCDGNIFRDISMPCLNGCVLNAGGIGYCVADDTTSTLCVDGKQSYALSGLNVDSECGVEFKSEIVTSTLSSLGKTNFTIENQTLRKILNITVNKTGVVANLSFTLDQDDFKFPITELLIYIEEGVAWTLLDKVGVSPTSGTLYTYIASAPHFSLFLIVEPDYCGNGVFEKDYYEECDGSIHCTACVCDSGYDADGSGNCVEEITGGVCSPIGNKTCTGYTLYECGSDLKWDNKGIVAGNCGVVCYPVGNISCQGYDSLLCGLNYNWINQGKISGQCGYVFTGTGDGDDSGEEGDGFKFLEHKGLLIFFIVLAVVMLFVIFYFMKSSGNVRETNPVATSKTVKPSTYPEQRYLF